MEIYKEGVYDLLDVRSRNKPLEEWTKVRHDGTGTLGVAHAQALLPPNADPDAGRRGRGDAPAEPAAL
jgi:hypothetical protein